MKIVLPLVAIVSFVAMAYVISIPVLAGTATKGMVVGLFSCGFLVGLTLASAFVIFLVDKTFKDFEKIFNK